MRKTIKFCCTLVIASLLYTQGAQAQQKEDSVINVTPAKFVNVAFGKVAMQDMPGGITTINVPELLKKSYGINSLDNLSGLVSGVTGGNTGFNVNLVSAANIWG